MLEPSDRQLAQIAREIADIVRDWFAEGGATSSEETLALIIIALEQRGFLFAETSTATPPRSAKIVPFRRSPVRLRVHSVSRNPRR